MSRTFSPSGTGERPPPNGPRTETEETLTDGGSTPACRPAATVAGDTTPSRIGPYRLRQKLGVGGMGEVWAAEQQEPVRRRVALKLIRAGMDSKQILARFESERQALALMSHPSIAAIYDAGVSETGRPYFVMEYVEGEPITAYCDRHRLPTGERLELFRQVCDAVQHAHQKGIIHRDLKPSNILVTVRDERPLPKVIDFGVAKATARRLTEKTVFTEFGQLIGTPEYMSPEQAEMTGLDIDTRSDVYSLGALLYELLAGLPPFDPHELRRAGFVEIQRRIREDEPPRPSTRVSRLGGTSSALAARRRLEPATLAGSLAGDLDWIVMKALDKDRTRRYGSASALAEDVGRHLRHEPVVAGPPGTAYRAHKFVRRHRVGVTAAALVALTLVAGTVGTTLGLIRARRAERLAQTEAETARRVSDFVVRLFEVSDPSEARGRQITAREILERGAARIEDELAGQPVVQSRLLHTLGKVYRGLGLLRDAEPWLERAVVVRNQSLGDAHLDTADSLQELAAVETTLGAYKDAERHLQRALAIRREAVGLEHAAVAETLSRLAYLYTEQRQFEKAATAFDTLIPLQERLVGPQALELASSLWSQARNSFYLHRLEDAELQAERALTIQEGALPPDHPDLARTVYLLAAAKRQVGKNGEAIDLYQRALAIQERVLGPDHPDVAMTAYHLGVTYLHIGRLSEAEPLMERVLDTGRKLFGPDSNHWRWGEALHGYAKLLWAQGRYAETIGIFEQVATIAQKAVPGNHAKIAHHLGDLAAAYLEQRRFAEAESTFARILAMEGLLGSDSEALATARLDLGRLYLEQARYPLAESQFERVLEMRRQTDGPESPAVASVLHLQGVLRRRQGRADEAWSLFERARLLYEGSEGPPDPHLAETLSQQGQLRAEQARPHEARALLARALEIQRQTLGAEHARTRATADALAALSGS